MRTASFRSRAWSVAPLVLAVLVVTPSAAVGAPAAVMPPAAVGAPAAVGVPAAVVPAAVAAPRCGPSGEGKPTETPWPLRRLNLTSVWPLTRGGGVTVAVIDSGVSATHPVLAGKVRDGRDVGQQQRDGQCDEVGHGTMVAGIIAGRSTTDVPFSGVAPDAEILPIRVFRDDKRDFGDDAPARIAEAITWATDHGARVINMSLEAQPTSELEKAVAYARDRDVVLVAAAGNQAGDAQRNGRVYPAGYDGVVAVAGVDEQGKHVDSSVSGDYIDVAAPGLNIIGPAPSGDGYRAEPEGGTSFAAAYVSGVAALIRSHKPEMPAGEVIERLIGTADRPPELRNGQVGYGVVNPYRAVTTILGTRGNPPAGDLVIKPRPADSMAWVRPAAVWTGVVGLFLVVTLLVTAPLVRRGRERGWRPGGRGRPAH